MATNDGSARTALARSFILKAVTYALDFGAVGWEDYPELSEFDFESVAHLAHQLAAKAAPSADRYADAYEHFASKCLRLEDG